LISLHDLIATPFRCSLSPLLGAYIADVYLGRFQTICVAVVIVLIGHILLIFSAIPGVIEHPDSAMGIFVVALVIMGLGEFLFFIHRVCTE
jgi:POT family proton-dependent oligopeptide transporter